MAKNQQKLLVLSCTFCTCTSLFFPLKSRAYIDHHICHRFFQIPEPNVATPTEAGLSGFSAGSFFRARREEKGTAASRLRSCSAGPATSKDDETVWTPEQGLENSLEGTGD